MFSKIENKLSFIPRFLKKYNIKLLFFRPYKYTQKKQAKNDFLIILFLSLILFTACYCPNLIKWGNKISIGLILIISVNIKLKNNNLILILKMIFLYLKKMQKIQHFMLKIKMNMICIFSMMNH